MTENDSEIINRLIPLQAIILAVKRVMGPGLRFQTRQGNLLGGSPLACEVSLDTRFKEDIGADSLDLIEIEMAIEDELGIIFNDNDRKYFVTVGEVVALIEQKLKGGSC